MERLADLPVSVELSGVLGQEVARYVEVEAGWQVVSSGGPPAPVLTLVDAPVPGRPCVVVVDGVPTAEQVRQGLFAGALDVLAWPADRARLLEAPLRLPAPETLARTPGFVRVAGVAGGVGTSTVTLALGALLAWSGRRAAVVGDQDLLALCGMAGWTGPGAAELAALGGAAAGEFETVARQAPGVPDLWVLAGHGAQLTGATGWPVDVVVADTRAQGPALAGAEEQWPEDLAAPPLPEVGAAGGLVVVARPDAAVRWAAPVAGRSVVVLAGRGPLDAPSVRRWLGRAPDAVLPASARVARAGLRGRVPSALPGTWLAQLRAPFVLRRRAS